MTIQEEANKYFQDNIPSNREKVDYLRHVKAVCKYALILGNKYHADPTILEVAALLHDIGADASKIHSNKSAEMAKTFLDEIVDDDNLKNKIISAIRNHSMEQSGESFSSKVALEDKIIRDADGLSFLESSTEGYFQQAIEKCSNLEEAKKETLNKIKGMRDKIETGEGKKLSVKLYNKAKEWIERQ